jgi:hypothetical protein
MPVINAGVRPTNSGMIKVQYVAEAASLSPMINMTTPVGGSYLIDWGDGVTDGLTEHTYASTGTYTICIILDDDGVTGIELEGAGFKQPTGTFPPALKSISYIGGAIGAFSFADVPTTITSLVLAGAGVTSTTGTPHEGLRVLNLSTNASLTSCPALPASLRVLNISNTGITGAPPTLPIEMEEFYMRGLTGITALAANYLPTTIKVFDCASSGRAALPTLRNTLEYIDVSGCTSAVTTVAYLGAVLKTFICRTCTGVTTIPGFRLCTQLAYVDTEGCTALNAAAVSGGIAQVAAASLVLDGYCRWPNASSGNYATSKSNLQGRGWTVINP